MTLDPAWTAGLRRHFECCGRVVWVTVAALRSKADGGLRFQVGWLPAPPDRLDPEDFAVFEAGRRQAEAEIRAYVESL